MFGRWFFNGQSTHQPAVWGWHGLWSLPIWIDNRKNFGYKVIFFFRKMELNIFFLNQMISPWFLVIRYEKDWLNTNPSEVGVLLGALLFWTSEVVAFRIGKPKKRQHTTIFFWFSTFWWDFLVNMAWSCWKGLWICIKWTFWWQPFILGPKMYPMMVHGFCTRPIAYIHIDRWLDPSVFRCRRDVRWFGCQVQPVAGAPNGPNGLAQASH